MRKWSTCNASGGDAWVSACKQWASGGAARGRWRGVAQAAVRRRRGVGSGVVRAEAAARTSGGGSVEWAALEERRRRARVRSRGK